MEPIRRFETVSVKEHGIYDVIMGIIEEFGIKIISTPVIIDYYEEDNNVIKSQRLESKTRRVFIHYGDDILQNITEASIATRYPSRIKRIPKSKSSA